MILARGRALEFDLPVTGPTTDLPSVGARDGDWMEQEYEYLTESEMQRRKRQNLFAVLQKSGWKIKGMNGAAALMGVNPSTLVSRIQKMGLRRPS